MKTFIVTDVSISRYGFADIEVSAETKEEALKKLRKGDFYVDDFNTTEDEVRPADLPDIEDLEER